MKGLDCRNLGARTEHGEASALTLTWKGEDERRGHSISLKAFPAPFASQASTQGVERGDGE